MKKLASRFGILIFTLIFMISSLTATASAVEPRFIGISELSVSLIVYPSGGASCYGYVDPYDTYSADMTLELQRDSTTIKTWTGSGSTGESFSLDKVHYVTSGHEYQVIVTVDVKNSRGSIVAKYSQDSVIEEF